MKVLHVTNKLRRAASLLFLIVPLFAYQVFELTNLPAHENHLEYLRPYVLATFGLSILFYVFLLRGYRWGFQLIQLTAVVWSCSSVILAIWQSNFLLGVHALILVTYWVLTINFVRFELGRSFFDPKLHWYQSTPKPIPHLGCEIEGEDIPFRVSRMDNDGAFLYLDHKTLTKDDAKKLRKSKIDLGFRFKDRAVKCKGRMMTTLGGGLGFGVQFTGMNTDERKELGDFVSCLQGEGFF